MNRLFSSMPKCVVVLVFTAFAAGCGPQVTLAPVTGTVTVDGQKLTSGQVSLIPVEKSTAHPEASAGTIDSNGEYKIFTGGKDGAPLGKYKVTVNPSMMPTGDTKAPTSPFNRLFMDPQSTSLTIEVVSGPAAGAYDLKLNK